MRLTPELFEQITGVKESSLEQLPSKGKDDLRAAPRVPMAFRSSACRIDGARFDAPIHVQVCDISAIGIGLTHAVEDRLGKTFVVAIKPRKKGEMISMHCEMTNFQSAGQTMVRVGAKFVRVGTEEDLRHCLSTRPVIASSVAPTLTNTARNAPSAPTGTPQSPASALAQVSLPATPVPIAPTANNAAAMSDEVKRIRDAMLS